MLKQLAKDLAELSQKHACDGHIDISVVQSICARIEAHYARVLAHENPRDPSPELSAGIVNQMITLQAHIIGDLQTVMRDSPHADLVEQCLALNKLVGTYLRT